MKSIKFTSKWNDKDVDLELIAVNNKIQKDSEVIANKAFKEAIDLEYPLAAQILQILKSRGITLDEEQVDKLSKEIRQKEFALETGKLDGKKLTKLEGRNLALELRSLRYKLDEIVNINTSYYSNTVEKYVQNERIKYFVYACLLDANTRTRFFKSYDEFKSAYEADHKLILDAFDSYYKMVSTDLFVAKEYSEEKFLKKFNFVNDKGQLINEQGKMVDKDFRLIDEKGFYINENGQRIDYFGNLIDENGNIIVDSSEEIYQE